MQTTNHIKQPKSQLAEVLYGLLTNDTATHDHFPYVRNLTARIADIRHRLNINVHCETLAHTNRFGHPSRIGVWSLPKDEREKAQRIYAEING